MAMYQKAKDKAVEVNSKLDAKADAEVEKLKRSKLTGLILIGAALLVVALLIL